MVQSGTLMFAIYYEQVDLFSYQKKIFVHPGGKTHIDSDSSNSDSSDSSSSDGSNSDIF